LGEGYWSLKFIGYIFENITLAKTNILPFAFIGAMPHNWELPAAAAPPPPPVREHTRHNHGASPKAPAVGSWSHLRADLTVRRLHGAGRCGFDAGFFDFFRQDNPTPTQENVVLLFPRGTAGDLTASRGKTRGQAGPLALIESLPFSTLFLKKNI
jgi:hypothetical protein